MRYYIIAGEPSGDMHAANLIESLREKDQNAHVRAWGGDKMIAQGADVVKHIRDLAFMGFVEVIANLRTISRNLKFCKNDLLHYKPDVLILVDYPGFNLRIAEFAHKNNIRVFYYISPQVWAWKKNRVKKIKQFVNRMFVILPFELDFYKEQGVDAFYGGNPVLDEIAKFQLQDVALPDENKEIIALLPGSRTQEIKRMLPVMCRLAKNYPQYHFVIAGVSHQKPAYEQLLKNDSSLEVIYDNTYHLLNNATAALVTSGTATLETALFKVPQVVCYAGSAISVFLARRLVKIRFISLVNLILDREAVKELIQSDLNTRTLTREFEKLLPGSPGRKEIVSSYDELIRRLGGAGASDRTANEMWNFLTSDS